MRIAPGVSASGCHWRCAITPRSNILRVHGARLSNWDLLTAHYSTGQDNQYFGWADAAGDNVQTLVDKFRERMPRIVDASRGLDWQYAGWYVSMLGYAERGHFPIAYSDWDEGLGPNILPLAGTRSDLLMPPPGDANQETNE